jgi:hypothetical protein
MIIIIFNSCRNETIGVTLWGQRAQDFSINSVCGERDGKPIVALFVGCLAKHFQGM